MEEYLLEFLNVREHLEKDWGITVFDDPIEREIDTKELSQTKKIMSECSERIRRRIKPDAALEHDAHLYYVVVAERRRFGNKAAWLLTFDTSLPRAARKLQGKDAVPFCMTIDGFLQIISPYVRADHEQSFAEMFVELVGNNLFPAEKIIEIDDFLMFTDFDLSVRRLPGEDVKKVIRRVKVALDGSIPLDAERQRVAYEVQKALSDPTLKYRTKLEEALKEKESQIKLNEEARERDRQKHDLEVESMESKHRTEFEELNRKLAVMTERGKQYEVQIEGILKKHRVAWFCFKAFGGIVVLALLVRGSWWLVDASSEVVVRPLLCKVSVLVAGVATWVAIISPRRLLSVVLFVLAALTGLYAVWTALFG